MNLVNELRNISKTVSLDKNLMLRIIGIDGTIIEGLYEGFTQALDNEPEIASISIQGNGYIISIDEDEIKSIEII